MITVLVETTGQTATIRSVYTRSTVPSRSTAPARTTVTTRPLVTIAITQTGNWSSALRVVGHVLLETRDRPMTPDRPWATGRLLSTLLSTRARLSRSGAVVRHSAQSAIDTQTQEMPYWTFGRCTAHLSFSLEAWCTPLLSSPG